MPGIANPLTWVQIPVRAPKLTPNDKQLESLEEELAIRNELERWNNARN
jgi:hypothetical protein